MTRGASHGIGSVRIPAAGWAAVGVLLAGSVVLAEDAVPKPLPPPAADRVWVGPMPFSSEGPRHLRPDFVRVLTDPTGWPTVLARTQVFKSYIMALPETPPPGREAPELADDQLRALVAFLRRHGLKVAFEVGGLRCREGERPTRGVWGRQVATGEFRHLKRWLDAGGSIDYLTTDHALMHNLGHRTYAGTDCGMAIAEAIEELADYFAAMRAHLPAARFGVIESLGYFHVRSPDGREYPRTVPKLPVWQFEEVFDTLCATMERRGMPLDHFHIDFGYEGVHGDGRRLQIDGLDFGRILGVERHVQSRGVKAGVIVNAFHDRSVAEPDPAKASRESHDRTVQFFEAYRAAGGRAEHVVFQTWQPFPDRTGPEDEPGTVLHLTRTLMLSTEPTAGGAP